MRELAPAAAGGDDGLPCGGCCAAVHAVQGPTHAYMQASPGCWALYGQLVARVAGEPVPPVVSWHHVDCYAVQHPGGAQTDRRQRQSVAVHLTTLCLLLEHGLPAAQASAVRGRMSQTVLPALGLTDWPHLAPPADRGTVTVADVHAAADTDQLAAQLQAWTHAAWAAWAHHHRTVRTWAAAAVGRRR